MADVGRQYGLQSNTNPPRPCYACERDRLLTGHAARIDREIVTGTMWADEVCPCGHSMGAHAGLYGQGRCDVFRCPCEHGGSYPVESDD